MPLPIRLLSALVLVTLAIAARAEPPDPEPPVELPPITIEAERRPDDLLGILLAPPLPCLGCDAQAVAAREPRTVRLLRWLLWPAVPPEPDRLDRERAQLIVLDSPELEYRLP